jgi:hypothetical protein
MAGITLAVTLRSTRSRRAVVAADAMTYDLGSLAHPSAHVRDSLAV